MGKDKLQEQWASLRREQILDAAARVFSERGFHQARSRDVAEEAGVSNGTVYNYFKSKEDILLGLLDRLNETASREAQMTALVDGEFRTMAETLLAHRLEVLWKEQALLRAVLPELLSNQAMREDYFSRIVGPSLEIATSAFEAMRETGQINTEDAALTVRLVAGSVVGVLLLRLLGDEVLEEKRADLPKAWGKLLFEPLWNDKANKRKEKRKERTDD
ncbi:TetR/AcrR family transcriptional regulator [Myxococcota bacterium]|nr:TetR/AcrR family transcriptional regulator [Myxococcota bacterium]